MSNYGLFYTTNTGSNSEFYAYMGSTYYSQPYYDKQPCDLCLTHFYSTCVLNKICYNDGNDLKLGVYTLKILIWVKHVELAHSNLIYSPCLAMRHIYYNTSNITIFALVFHKPPMHLWTYRLPWSIEIHPQWSFHVVCHASSLVFDYCNSGQ